MDGKFHLFAIIVTLISSVYEMPHKICRFPLTLTLSRKRAREPTA
jgi:hypothetical protein